MARITKISITLCALLFTSLTLTPAANASQQARHSAVQKSHLVKATERKKKTTTKNEKKKTTTKTTQTASSKTKTKSSRTAHTTKSKTSLTAANLVTEKCITRKGHKAKCTKVTKIAEVHKVRVQKAQKTAMNKLMGQIGKPYRWGADGARLLFLLAVVVLVGVIVVACHVEHSVGDEILAGAVYVF